MKMQRLTGILFLMTLCLPGLTYAEDCQITLSQPLVDYRQMRRDNVVTTQQNWHKMSEREVNVNVFCPEKQKMAVFVQGTAGEKGRFQFGLNGGLGVKVDNLTLDGKSYSVGKTNDQVNFTPDSKTESPFYIRNNEGVIAVENDQVPSGQQMSFKVTVFPVLNDSAFSNNTDETSLESELTWRLAAK
ncbi:hypothetical protein ACQ3G4_18320 [bacterium BS0013]|jgi:hypothetical protein|uniref:hypothetical protein n=1 Tax=unclassified Enterobacter TaxID=2608935 RepID=UPI00292B516E|nr:hypothetical protein [Enterobacter sp. 23-M-SZ-13]MDV0595206.1 hypothetical protein [Enterobacter sp. 23-M-SZ-13]